MVYYVLFKIDIKTGKVEESTHAIRNDSTGTCKSTKIR